MQPLALIVSVALAFVLAGAASAQQPAEAPAVTTISGGGLLRPLTLAPIDQVAFLNRLDLPPLFDFEPVINGPAYTVRSPYWDIAIRDDHEDQPKVNDVAEYYPEGGFVLAKQGAREVWTALDTRQRAILDRYIRVAAALPDAPLAFDVIRAAAQAKEGIGVSVGPNELTVEQRAKFWEAAKDLRSTTGPPPASTPDLSQPNPAQSWVIFTLPEGRTVQMLYSTTANTLTQLDEGAQGRFYAVPRDWLTPVVGASASLQPLQIQQEHSTGSPIWWLIGLGGGIACIAAAFFIQRRLAA